MLDTETILLRYEEIRPRLPEATMSQPMRRIGSVLEVAQDIDAFVFDAFGVLNVGERLIDGADRRLDALRDRGCQIRVLTNAASYDRTGAIAKFKRLGLRLFDDEIITSRNAALMHLPPGHLGVICTSEDALSDVPGRLTRLDDDAHPYDLVDAVLFLSAAEWTDARQGLLHRALQRRPRPLIVANADLVAPRDHGFSLEPGHYGHLIADDLGAHVRFFGKPFPEVYSLVEDSLPGVDPARIAMCGDTPHTDIIGAAARGWRTVLVTADGLLAGRDATGFCERSGLHADWCLPRI